MNFASVALRQSNLHIASQLMIGVRPHKCSLITNNLSLKTLNSSSPKVNITTSAQSINVSRANKIRDQWMEFQGIKNWEGLLDPLDDGLRCEILRYGEFVEAGYRCFDFDTSTPGYATYRYPRSSLMAHCGLGNSGYKVIKSLHATSEAHLPSWTEQRVPHWVSTRSSWIGYVAVCNDKNVIARLGRRDVVIAYRGTATCMEWLENLRVTLTGLPGDDCEPMVQRGFLSLYTSSTGSRKSLQDSVRNEIRKVLQKYADEPLSTTVTGHSLGAALAALTAHDIAATFKHAPLVTVMSCDGPRVGNKSFGRQLEISGTKVLRIVNSDVPTTKVPGYVLKEEQVSKWLQKRVDETQWVYAEIGEELRLSSRDCPHLSKGSMVTCHDLKTYLHLVDNFVSSNCPLRATAKRVLKGA